MPDSAAWMFLMPWMTASLSPSLWKNGCVDTVMLSAEVMVVRPRETWPRPRYWLMVIASEMPVS